jgi:hypothetical protein
MALLIPFEFLLRNDLVKVEESLETKNGSFLNDPFRLQKVFRDASMCATGK